MRPQNIRKTKFFMVTNYVRLERDADFSYTILDREIRGSTDEAAMENVISRTEYEAETRRERFQAVELIPKIDGSYTVNLWVDKQLSCPTS